MCNAKTQGARPVADQTRLNNLVAEYQPMQREYGRLSLSGSVLSKRKLRELVEKKFVRGWVRCRILARSMLPHLTSPSRRMTPASTP